jgi:hypothetical protein
MGEADDVQRFFRSSFRRGPESIFRVNEKPKWIAAAPRPEWRF